MIRIKTHFLPKSYFWHIDVVYLVPKGISVSIRPHFLFATFSFSYIKDTINFIEAPQTKGTKRIDA